MSNNVTATAVAIVATPAPASVADSGRILLGSALRMPVAKA